MPMSEHGEWPPDEATAGQDPAADVTEPIHHGPPPEPENTPEGPVLEPHRDGDEDENSQQGSVEEEKPLPQFDEKFKQALDGLMYLGRLEDEFSWLGHRYVIRTLTTDEILQIGIITKPYLGTLSEVKAYQAAVVAACIVTVDGKSLAVPMTNEAADTALRNRWDYVRNHWFPPLLDYVYEQYLLLEDLVRQVLDAMGKASR